MTISVAQRIFKVTLSLSSSEYLMHTILGMIWFIEIYLQEISFVPIIRANFSQFQFF